MRAGFQSGSKKPEGSGVRTGSRQLRPMIRRRVREVLDEAGIEPVNELLRLIPSLAPRDQVRAYLELIAYCYPRLSAVHVETVESQGADTEAVPEVKELETEELITLVKQG